MSEKIHAAAKTSEAVKNNQSHNAPQKVHSQSMNSPLNYIMSLHGKLGNRAVQRLFESGAIQAKLSISQPGDAYEQEADRVADQVMRMPEPALQRKLHPALGSSCLECQEEEQKLIQRKAEQAPAKTDVSISDNFVQSLGAGRPLDSASRAYFEPRFGYDFSNVRMHTDGNAVDAAKAIDAQAFTMGRNVVFGEGRYTPESIEGQRLLAHELTHVVQQEKNLHLIQRRPVHVSGNESDVQDYKKYGDRVLYDGSRLIIYRGGKIVVNVKAVSGHPGSKEFQKGVGPIPDEKYNISPHITRPKVTKLQKGICGAEPISSGYQEVTSADLSPCDDPSNHYCTVACPTATDTGRRCFTPVDCWGKYRIKIEGAATVKGAGGKMVTRGGFYIHGGNSSVAVTSGCIKVFDDSIFFELRKFKKRVPLIVKKN